MSTEDGKAQHKRQPNAILSLFILRSLKRLSLYFPNSKLKVNELVFTYQTVEKGCPGVAVCFISLGMIGELGGIGHNVLASVRRSKPLRGALLYIEGQGDTLWFSHGPCITVQLYGVPLRISWA